MLRRALTRLAPACSRSFLGNAYVAGDTWLVEHSTPASSPSTVVLRLGISEAALDALGDVEALEWPTSAEVSAGATLCSLRWTGFSRTASDELYHATWANISGTHNLRSPLPGTLLLTNAALQPDKVDARSWLAQMSCSRAAWDLLRRADRSV